ncbi:hypothetical protein [Thermococcus paralvinellae]|uniref:Uncharacterized protein n=1 Tax=Thermococcus paralvinellae TaxID=582419 RepID=W0I8B6_9EURY|nr:hypothetical protein [Thermococcus paralvinellae]AHF80967.1 Hypothetical protein TES1_1591 [Thermococcus paralvinellae]
MDEENLTPSEIVVKLIKDNPDLKLEEAQPGDIGIDPIADGYFSPDLDVSINIKKVKIFKVHNGEDVKAFWINGFMLISRGMVIRNHKTGAIADLILIKLSKDRVLLKGALNGKPIMAYFEVEPSEWFIDALIHAAGILLKDYGERSLTPVRDG